MSTPRRGEVWNVRFDPAVGAEIQKVRPAVVLSMDGVGRLPLKIVVPITDWKPAFAHFAWFIYLSAAPSNGLTKDSGADAFQVKSVSEGRFVDKLDDRFVSSAPVEWLAWKPDALARVSHAATCMPNRKG